MTYNVSLSHDDFVLLIDVLKTAQDSGLISWSATALVCENTKSLFLMNIQIKVFAGKTSMDANQRLFEQIVKHDDSVSVPYEKITEVLRFFYPGSIVQFNIQ